MPAIPNEILDTVVCLYPDEQAARDGERAGGSGCLVVIPVQQDPLVGFMYIVTNSHVIREGKASAIRVNTKDGGLGIIHSTADGWIHRPNGDDRAVRQ
jgi:S1-C subfamily serine protease